MLKHVLGILLLHIPIAFLVFFPQLCAFTCSLFISILPHHELPTLLTAFFFIFLLLSRPPSSWSLTPYPKCDQEFSLSEKNNRTKGAAFLTCGANKKIKCYLHSLIQPKIKIRQMASPFVWPFYTSGFGLISKWTGIVPNSNIHIHIHNLGHSERSSWLLEAGQ